MRSFTSGDTPITVSPGSGLRDAFSRLRVSNPITIFDYASEYDEGDLVWAESGTNGTVTHTAADSAVTISTGTTANDEQIRQTRAYHRYQPGKSQLILATFDCGTRNGNSRWRIGYFDADGGVFLQRDIDGTVKFVLRKGGSDTAVAATNWNTDTYPTLDLTKAQLLFFDLEWLSVGRVRCGFFHNGEQKTCHVFDHDNSGAGAYMRSANLPIRMELTNTEGGTADSVKFMCCSVISEGGVESERAYRFSANTGITADAVTTREPVIAIRPKATFNSIANRGLILPESVSVYTDAAILVELCYSGSFTSASFSSVNASSLVEYDVAATAIASDLVVDSFYVPASGAGALSQGASELSLASRLPLTLDIAGANPVAFSIVVTSISGTANVQAAVTWSETR